MGWNYLPIHKFGGAAKLTEEIIDPLVELHGTNKSIIYCTVKQFQYHWTSDKSSSNIMLMDTLKQLLSINEFSWPHSLNRWPLTHWGWVTHICVSKLTIIGSDNGLSPGRRQAIIWANAGMLLIGPLGIKYSGILMEIDTFPFKKIHLKMSPGKCRPFCLSLNVLIRWPIGNPLRVQILACVHSLPYCIVTRAHTLLWFLSAKYSKIPKFVLTTSIFNQQDFVKFIKQWVIWFTGLILFYEFHKQYMLKFLKFL